MAIGHLTRRAKAAKRVEVIHSLEAFLQEQEDRLRRQLQPTWPDYVLPDKRECEVEVRK